MKLKRMSWGTWHPHKVKLAVSGCPRNGEAAIIKDFGVVAVDSGRAPPIGGNGGIHLRATDLPCKVTTEAELLEYRGAFLQLYREEAHDLGGPLSQGIMHGHAVTCPLHNRVIALASVEAQAPDIGCVKRRPLRPDGDRILLGAVP